MEEFPQVFTKIQELEIRALLPKNHPKQNLFIRRLSFHLAYYGGGSASFQSLVSKHMEKWIKEKGASQKVMRKIKDLRKAKSKVLEAMEEWERISEKNRPPDDRFQKKSFLSYLLEIEHQIIGLEGTWEIFAPQFDGRIDETKRAIIETTLALWSMCFPENPLPTIARQGRIPPKPKENIPPKGSSHAFPPSVQVCGIALHSVTGEVPKDISRLYESTIKWMSSSLIPIVNRSHVSLYYPL